MKIKRLAVSLAVLASLILFVGLNPALSLAKEKYTEKFEKTVKLAKDGKVVIGNISGDIEVLTWNKAEVKIDAEKISRTSSQEKAKKNFDRVTIEVIEDGRTVRIKTVYAKNSFRSKSSNCSVNYTVTIPSGADAEVRSVSGDVSLKKIGGAVKTKVTSGDVTIEEVGGVVNVKTTSGDVDIRDAKNDVGCYVVSGNLDLRNISGDIDLETVSGDINLSEVSDVQVIKAKVLSGKINYEGALRSGGRYNMNTHSGTITMILPGNSAFDLEARTFSGKIDSEFDITVSGTISRKKISGSVNGGGADLELKTFSGNVRLKKK